MFNSTMQHIGDFSSRHTEDKNRTGHSDMRGVDVALIE